MDSSITHTSLVKITPWWIARMPAATARTLCCTSPHFAAASCNSSSVFTAVSCNSSSVFTAVSCRSSSVFTAVSCRSSSVFTAVSCNSSSVFTAVACRSSSVVTAVSCRSSSVFTNALYFDTTSLYQQYFEFICWIVSKLIKACFNLIDAMFVARNWEYVFQTMLILLQELLFFQCSVNF